MTGTIGQYQRHLNEFPNGNLGAAATIDFVANGVYQSGVLNSATCTITFVNPRVHSTVWLEFIQDATGGRVLTFPVSVVGTLPPLNAAANASTLFELLWNGTNYQFTSSSAAVAGVSSFNSRSGAVSPAASDYTATQITNTSSVSGAFVKDALNTLLASIGSIVAGVSSFNTRTGAVSPASGDYAASQVTNDSTVTGVGVAAALNTLKASIAALVTGVSSFKTRTGAVTPAAGDYAASKVNNDSATVAGLHVSDALDALKALTGVTSFKTRTGAVVPAAGDYAASQVNNDSTTVAGTHVSDALDTLKSLIAASVTGVSSVYGRTGAVVAAVGDYTASKINNDSGVSGLHVKEALDNLAASITALVVGVSSVYGRTGAVVATTGDYAASQVTNNSTVIGTGVSGALNTLKAQIAALVASSIGNDSSVTGTTVKDALQTLKASITALVTGVSSVYGRTGAVVAAAGDYAASKINNDSATVTGVHVSDALDALKASIGTSVSSVFGRTGAVLAVAGDYAASKINNDSTVTGTHVSDALNTLKAASGVSSVFGRTGAVVAVAGDYPASKINNDSVVGGSHVSDTLSNLLLEFQSATVISANHTFVLADVGTAFGVSSAGTVNLTIPAQGTVAFRIGSRISYLKLGTGPIVLAPAVGVTVLTSGTLPTRQYTLYHLDYIDSTSDTWLLTAIAALSASDIANDSSLAGSTVKAALEALTSDEISNQSDIVAVNVSDALNFLNTGALRGDVSIPLIGQIPGGGTSDWDFWSTGAFWAGGGHNKAIFFALGPIPPGAHLTAVKVAFIPNSGHSALPTIKPSFQLVRQTPASVATIVSGSLVNVTAASVPAYEVGQQWTSSAFVPQVANQSSYWLEFFDEGGSNAFSGLTIVNITITLA